MLPIEMRGLCPLIQVFDMPTSLSFYRDVLGFELVNRSSDSDDCGWAWLRCNDAELMLNTAYDEGKRPQQKDAARTRAHNDTCLFIGCPEIEAAYEYLRSKNVAVSAPEVAPYGMKQISLKDPDGFSICFQWKVQV